MIEKNTPGLWASHFPFKKPDQHKYDHGHAVVYAAPSMTGATRLAAQSCARAGAGLVSVLANNDIANVYRVALPAHIIVRDDLNWIDDRVTARLYGSGGLSVAPDFDLNLPTVLDGDALSEDLPEKLSEQYVLTPHEGEFKRVFPQLEGAREARICAAAKQSGAVLVLKGSDTLIAHPEGRLVVNSHSTPALATAGTGDVLAGILTGLLAQRMPVFEAVCASVWIHGEAGLRFGPGLVADDLLVEIPNVIKKIHVLPLKTLK